MKVKMDKKYKEYMTLMDVDRAKLVIASEKEDMETAAGWAEYAAREALKDTCELLTEIIHAEARTAMNSRIWGEYGESGSVDVWIDFLARTSKGFLEGGAYLSDIWQSGSVPYKHHMWIRKAEWK